jgi:hypothetical protein
VSTDVNQTVLIQIYKQKSLQNILTLRTFKWK